MQKVSLFEKKLSFKPRSTHRQWNDNDTIAATANNVIEEGKNAGISFCTSTENALHTHSLKSCTPISDAGKLHFNIPTRSDFHFQNMHGIENNKND